MTTPQLTEERLRSYLDSNQAARERLCVAILKTDRRFSDVRPRHPKGGKDGGRDIEAKYQGTDVACGAVGFMNGANDSAYQKKKISNKFKDDLNSAKKADNNPTVFVFFTNIALTAGEKSNLIKIANTSGMLHCDIFDRERIRVLLDSTDGLAIRVQYLDISMSSAEQATFFGRWGDDIQSLVSSRFQSVESTLARIMFLQEARSTLETISVRFILDRTYTGDEIGHFRAFTSFYFPKMRRGLSQALFGITDNSQRFHPRPFNESETKPGVKHGVSYIQWESRFSDDPTSRNIADEEDIEYNEYVPHGRGYGVGSNEIKQLVISYNHTDTFDFQFLPRLSLEDIQGSWVMPKLSARLAEKLSALEIIANGYVILSLEKEDFRICKSNYDFPVEGHFTDEELKDPWVRVRPSAFSSNFAIDFYKTTPKRSFKSKEHKSTF